MKILLLNPPSENKTSYIREGRCTQEQGVWSTLWPPITLATAGAMLEERKHDVDILDGAVENISIADLLDRIRKIGYHLVAWSTGTPTISSDLSLADKIKNVDGRITTVVFGTHVTVLAEECLKKTGSLDIIVRNEPEMTLIDLAACVENNGNLDTVTGISYRNHRGEICHNESRPFIQNMDELPYPAWHKINLDRYRLPLIGEKFLMLSPIRGCPYPCTFCTAQIYYGSRPRRRSIPKIIGEIEYGIRRFNIRHFFIWADTFTVDRNYVLDLCRSICDRLLDIRWACNSRVDTVDREMLETMAGAGCWMISYGIESANQHILDNVGKAITRAQSEHAVNMAKRAGMMVAGHFIMGLPGENENTLQETIDFSVSLDLDIAQFYSAAPFPGTMLYKSALKNGWLQSDDFGTFCQDRAVLDLPGLSPDWVDAYRRKAYATFYMNPKRIIRILGLLRLRGIVQVLRNGGSFLKWSDLISDAKNISRKDVIRQAHDPE